MFNHSSNIGITDSTINYISTSKNSLDILYKNAAPGAFHDSDERYDAPKCHPETRTAVQEDIINRVLTAVTACIIWLYGGAGAGKSAIAQSIASTCADDSNNTLLGSFFFSRAAALRNNAKRLAASLAYQLAVAIPETLPSIAGCINSNPAVFESNLEKQLMALFIQPLAIVCAQSPAFRSRPRLVILDGLDECDSPQVQAHIIGVLSKVLVCCPIPLAILIASRPEVHIQTAFADIDRNLKLPTSQIGLNDEYDANNDIRLFLDSKFSSIARNHRFRAYLPPNWPNTRDVTSIVERSSGHFIFPATIIRWVESDRHKPHERLSAALNAAIRYAARVRDSPFKELDALYLQIFSTLEDPALSLAILYLRLRNNDAKTPVRIEFQLRLSPGDVDIHLSPLASLVRVERSSEAIEVLHASLHDFLFDASRSLDFYIQQPAVKTVLCRSYLLHTLDSAVGGDESDQCWYDGLRQFSEHYTSAVLEEQLPDISAIKSKVPQFLHNFPHYPMLSLDGSSFIHASFSNLVDILTRIETTIQSRLGSSFQLCEGFSEHFSNVMARELSFFAANQDTLDFLALLAFEDSRVWTAPDDSIAEVFGVDLKYWSNRSRPHPFCNGTDRPVLPVSRCLDVLRRFLRDKAISNELFIEDQTFARLAYRCAMFLSLRSPSGSVVQVVEIDNPSQLRLMTFVGSRHHWTSKKVKVDYWWMVKAMKSMLKLAPWDPELSHSLQKFDYTRFLVYEDHKYVIETIGAIRSYVETHESTAVADYDVKSESLSSRSTEE